jgi:DNA-binding response OmpR family regulator
VAVRLSQFPPSILVASGDDALRVALSRRLRAYGYDVLEIRDAETFHALVLEGTHCDLFILDESLPGCSPFHGLAYGRMHGVDAATIAIVRAEDAHAQTEARRLDMILAQRSRILGSLEALLLDAFQNMPRRDSRAA